MEKNKGRGRGRGRRNEGNRFPFPLPLLPFSLLSLRLSTFESGNAFYVPSLAESQTFLPQKVPSTGEKRVTAVFAG